MLRRGQPFILCFELIFLAFAHHFKTTFHNHLINYRSSKIFYCALMCWYPNEGNEGWHNKLNIRTHQRQTIHTLHFDVYTFCVCVCRRVIHSCVRISKNNFQHKYWKDNESNGHISALFSTFCSSILLFTHFLFSFSLIFLFVGFGLFCFFYVLFVCFFLAITVFCVSQR